jgi:porin
MEQNPQAASRSHAWSWSTKGSKGILLPMEIETRPLINGLPGAITSVWSGLTRRKAISTAANPAAPGRPIRKAMPSTTAPGLCTPASTSRLPVTPTIRCGE